MKISFLAAFLVGLAGGIWEFTQYLKGEPQRHVTEQTHAFFQKVITGQETKTTVAYIVSKLDREEYPTVKPTEFLDQKSYDIQYRNQPERIKALRDTITQAWATGEFDRMEKKDPSLEPFLQIARGVIAPTTEMTVLGKKTTGIDLDQGNLWPSLAAATDRITYAQWMQETWKDILSDPSSPHVEASFQKEMKLIKIAVHEKKNLDGRETKYLSILSLQPEELETLPNYKKILPYIKNF